MGDRNTTFYHRSITQRNLRNHIHFLQDGQGNFIGETSDIKAHAASYFQGILGETDMSFSPVDVAGLRELLTFNSSELQQAYLKMDVLAAEIQGTIFSMLLNKSPGPDGYPVEFIRSSWECVGSDVIAAIGEFFRNGRLLKDLYTTTIVLIPKSNVACKLQEYMPISCYNIVYKVITKILTNRLKPILRSCISKNQAAFLKGRSLGENVLPVS